MQSQFTILLVILIEIERNYCIYDDKEIENKVFCLRATSREANHTRKGSSSGAWPIPATVYESFVVTCKTRL